MNIFIHLLPKISIIKNVSQEVTQPTQTSKKIKANYTNVRVLREIYVIAF